MIQLIAAVFLVLHGLAHLLWLISGWDLAEIDGLPHRTTLFSGRIDIGANGMRLLGILWSIGAAGFLIAGLGLMFSTAWWWQAAIIAALYSLLLCVISWPESRWGALINLAVIALLLVENSGGPAIG
ncbi:MAG: hypothetical protein R3335_08975 [Anaerolineales bacterium]|nr:hypothetical protein [Anaerolineales bacterium]